MEITDKSGKVCVIGIWHLGSVVSACLADLGYLVVGCDKDKKRVEALNKGTPPLFEPGLSELIAKGINSRKLSYTTDMSKAVKGSGFVLITFDTPIDDNDEVDLSELRSTVNELGKYLEKGAVVIVSSQVPVGSCDELKAVIKNNNPLADFDIAYSPENLRLGKAIDIFKHPDRIVIGADSRATLDKVGMFFDIIKSPKVTMSLRSAEMAKHAINAFLATCISFANEVGNLCDEVGADAMKVAEALNLEERIGPKLPLKPGLAFAGGTLARDIKILRRLGDKNGFETYLVDGVLEVNLHQNKIVLRKLEKIFGATGGLTVGVLGLTYKAGTSTMRRSVALEIIRGLSSTGAKIKAHDPKADLSEVKLNHEFEFCADPYDVARGSDALVIATDWPEFKELDYDLIKSIMRKPVIIDARNMLDKDRLLGKGFLYSGIGRGTDYAIKQ